MARHWLIIGAGISGKAAAHYLSRGSGRVTVVDSGAIPPCPEFANAALLPSTAEPQLEEVTDIVLSPSVREDHPTVVKARTLGIAIWSEPDLALHDYTGKLIAITGTNGKSTTTAMSEHILKRIGYDAAACGNIGLAPSQIRAKRSLPPYLALEISSYQIEQSTRLRPAFVAWTSFAPDHLARHGTLEGYFRTKWKLFEMSASTTPCVMTTDVDDARRSFGVPELSNPYEVLRLGTLENPWPEPLRGVFRKIAAPVRFNALHDYLNAAFAAYACAHVTGKTPDELVPLLDNFVSLPHRLQIIGRHRGQPIYNDSKSTNVESTLFALRSMPQPCTLFLGGVGKGESYSPILSMGKAIAEVVTFGPAAPEIVRDLSPQLVIRRFPTLADALRDYPFTVHGPVLFSPGCASFDEFKNFEDRGRFFVTTITSRLGLRA